MPASSRSDMPAAVAARMLRRMPLLVAEKRRRTGLSQSQAAREIGVGKTALHKIEHGGDVNVASALAFLAWLGDVAAPDIESPLTGAAQDVLDLLYRSDGLGQAWLRIEPNAYGLVLPDIEGTLGELRRWRGLSWATWGELEALQLVRRGLPDVVPPHVGPRNRTGKNHGYPIEINREATHG